MPSARVPGGSGRPHRAHTCSNIAEGEARSLAQAAGFPGQINLDVSDAGKLLERLFGAYAAIASCIGCAPAF